MRFFRAALAFALCGLLAGPPAAAQGGQTSGPVRIQNIAPEEMWNRVTQCAFPTYPAQALDSHISGTVNVGLGISPEGNVTNTSRVLGGPPSLVQSAMVALMQWKFQPNTVQGEATWSRVRALVRFNDDGTTAVDLAPGNLADSFGDPGTPWSAATAVPRPSNAPVCKSMGSQVSKLAPKFEDGAYLPGFGGIGGPTCVACPEPTYSKQALSAKISGTIRLQLIVTAEGRATNIQVLRSLGYGLDEKAVEAVRDWQFKPGMGPDGKPVPVRIAIEISFRVEPQTGVPLKAAPATPAARGPAPIGGDFPADFQAAATLAREGRTLSLQQVSDLEDRLKSNPDDVSIRVQLLGYYFTSSIQAGGADATHAARRRYILWMIEHHPEAELMMLPEITIDPAGHPLADAEGYSQAKQLWIRQADVHPDDVGVLIHAARFFRLSDKALALKFLKQALTYPASPDYGRAASELGAAYAITILGVTMVNQNGLPMAADPIEAASDLAQTAVQELRASSNDVVISTAGNLLAQYGVMAQALTKGAVNQDALTEELLKKAVAIEPPNLMAPRTLAEFYWMRMQHTQNPAERQTLAELRLEQAELFVQRAKASAKSAPADRQWVPSSLLEATKAAFDAGATDKAKQFANDLLAADDSSGQSFHEAHVILGRVALKKGMMDQAKAQLLQAGRTSGGGTLTSFGPSMSLAKELLDQGERDTVVTYLQECLAFWPRPQLSQWIQTIKAGGTPNFGANLLY